MISRVDRTWLAPRLVVGFLVATACGVAVGLADSSPGWDDSGITAAALVASGAVAAIVAGRRPWLVALLVGAFVPLLEIPRGAGAAPLISFVFGGVGAALGYLTARAFSPAATA